MLVFLTNLAVFAALANPVPDTGAADAWPLFRPADGGFTVRMPPGVQEDTHQTDTDRGAVVRTALTSTWDKVLYQVSYVDLPWSVLQGRSPQDVFRLAQDGARNGQKVHVVRQGTGFVDGRPFQRYRVDIPNGHMVFNQLVLDGARLYHLMVVTPPAYMKRCDSNGFFESFGLAG